jgi:hypothetical protein
MSRALVWSCILMITVVVRCSAAAQTFPAEIQGSWQIDRKLDVTATDWSGSCLNGGIGVQIKIGEHSIHLETGSWRSVDVASPSLVFVPAEDFARKHLSKGISGLKELGISASKIEVITNGGPTDSSLFERLLVKDPNMLSATVRNVLRGQLGRCRQSNVDCSFGVHAPTKNGGRMPSFPDCIRRRVLQYIRAFASAELQCVGSTARATHRIFSDLGGRDGHRAIRPIAA